MWCVNAGEDHLDVMSRKPGAFHKNHGKGVRLLEEDIVAYGTGSVLRHNVVFTSQPIPQGSMFQVKILDTDGPNLRVSGVIFVSVTYPRTLSLP